MELGGKHLSYLHHCPRQLWLYAHGIRPQDTDPLVLYGEAVDQTSHTRKKPVDLGAAKLDWVDRQAWVHEQKSSRREHPGHREQAAHYCLLLGRLGVPVAGFVLHYPLRRRTITEPWTPERQAAAESAEAAAAEVVSGPCPGRLPRARCCGCSYVPVCWASEV